MEGDSELIFENYFDLTRTEIREKAAGSIKRMMELYNLNKGDTKFRQILWDVMNNYDFGLGLRVYVHQNLFTETLYSQGNNEQWEQWRDACLTGKIFGSYAMTGMTVYT